MNKDKHKIILEAALDLFTEHGVQDTPTSLIVKKANVATGTLFNYFHSKELLIHELYKYCKASMVESLKYSESAEQDISSLIKGMFENAISWCITNKKKFKFYQYYCNSTYNNETIQDNILEFDFIYSIIEKGKQHGYLKDMPTVFLYSVSIGIIIQIMGYCLQSGATSLADCDVDKLYLVFWDAIKK